jgi:hypothetical protein
MVFTGSVHHQQEQAFQAMRQEDERRRRELETVFLLLLCEADSSLANRTTRRPERDEPDSSTAAS